MIGLLPDRWSAPSVDICIVWSRAFLSGILWTDAVCGEPCRGHILLESLPPPPPPFRIGSVSYSEDQDRLGSLMRHLLPTPVVSPPRAVPIPSEREQLIQHLMGKEHAVRPLLPERSSFTDMEILLQSLLPVGSLGTEHPLPAVGCHGSTVVCFLCGESGYPASRCPTLDDTFPFLPPVWQAEWTGDGFVMRSPQKEADRYQAGNVV